MITHPTIVFELSIRIFGGHLLRPVRYLMEKKQTSECSREVLPLLEKVLTELVALIRQRSHLKLWCLRVAHGFTVVLRSGVDAG